MMRYLRFVLVLTIVLGSLQIVSAQRPRASKDSAISSNPLAALIDENNDGVLSAREIRQAGNAIRKLDTDGDGKITADEIEGTGEDDDDPGDDDDDRDSRKPPTRSARAARPSRDRDDESDEAKRSLEEAINQAAKYYRQKKFKEAGTSVRDAIDALETLDDADQLASVSGSISRLERAHQLLEKQGIDLPKLPKFGAGDRQAGTAQSDSDSSGSAAEPQKTAEPSAVPGPSFTRKIAPIFAKRCSGCHIDKREGDLSLASYANLMEGSDAGVVIESGDPDNSIIVELVQEGEMPPKGGPIPKDEIQLIVDWVDAGAHFDGEDESSPIK